MLNQVFVSVMLMTLLSACSLTGPLGGEQGTGTTGSNGTMPDTTGSQQNGSVAPNMRSFDLQACLTACETSGGDKSGCKDGCYISKAVADKNPNYCEEIEDFPPYNSCYTQLAIAARNPNLCDNLYREDGDACRSAYDASFGN